MKNEIKVRTKLSVEEVMSRTELAGEDLSSISLGNKDLSGKNFRGTDLSFAHMGAANLAGADLRNAKLYQTNLGAADLSGADLRYADLRESNLKGTILKGADFREAIGLDLSSPVDLEYLVKPVKLKETEDYGQAKVKGFHTLAHWGTEYALDTGKTLKHNETVWLRLKQELGDSIFGDRKIYSEVRLIQQYKEYSQWAYMISKKGFLRITQALGLKVHEKHS